MTAYDEGNQAFYDGADQFDNPYREGTDAFEEWFNGYHHADTQESGDFGEYLATS